MFIDSARTRDTAVRVLAARSAAFNEPRQTRTYTSTQKTCQLQHNNADERNAKHVRTLSIALSLARLCALCVFLRSQTSISSSHYCSNLFSVPFHSNPATLPLLKSTTSCVIRSHGRPNNGFPLGIIILSFLCCPNPIIFYKSNCFTKHYSK